MPEPAICSCCEEYTETPEKVDGYEENFCPECAKDFRDRMKLSAQAPRKVRPPQQTMAERVALVAKAMEAAQVPSELGVQGKESAPVPVEVPKEPPVKKTKGWGTCPGCKKHRYLIQRTGRCSKCGGYTEPKSPVNGPVTHSAPPANLPPAEPEKMPDNPVSGASTDLLDGLSFYRAKLRCYDSNVIFSKKLVRFTKTAADALELEKGMLFHVYGDAGENPKRIAFLLRVHRDSDTLALKQEGVKGLAFSAVGLRSAFPHIPEGRFPGKWEKQGKDRFLIIDFTQRSDKQ